MDIEKKDDVDDSEIVIKQKHEKSKSEDAEPKKNIDLESAEKRASESENRLKYLQADFENYRKQTSREFRELAQFGNNVMLRKMIDHREDLARAINDSGDDIDELMKGIKMILGNLDTMLSEDGVEKIKTDGVKFDPNFHEATSFSKCDKDEGTIVSELRKGYTIHGKVLRPSVVEVASKKDKVEVEQNLD